jgi:hypothetical protein
LLSFLATGPLKSLWPGRSAGELNVIVGSIGFLATTAVAVVSMLWLRKMSPFRTAGMIGLLAGFVGIAFVALSESHMTKLGPVVIAIAAIAVIAVGLFALLAILRRRLF